MNRVIRFIDDDQGADLIEYALLVGLIALAMTACSRKSKPNWTRLTRNQLPGIRRKRMGTVMRLIADDGGADLVEYAILVGLLALATIAGLNGVGTSIKTIWDNMNTKIQGAIP